MTLQLRPTFSESWYRVVLLRPRLRATAQVSRQHYRGDRWYVVRDPAGNQFHRLSETAYRFIGLLDGSRTVGEAWELVGGQLADDAPTQPEVIQMLSQLYAANLIETDVTPDSEVLLRRYKKQQKQKTKQRLMNILFPRIPLWDPDRFIKAWMPLIRFMLSWTGAVVWLSVITAALVVVLPDWSRLSGAGASAIAPSNWAWLWVTFVAVKFVHEMGHAFSCRRFGGEVHEVGIMFLVLVPTPYVDASSAWSFSNKWKRVFVGAGGMIFELFVAALAAFVWKNTGGDSLWNQLAFNTMLIASFSTIVFNANPLLRYDGYYILSDILEIPNLQNKSREYTLGLIKRHVFRVKSQQPLPPAGQRAWLFFYSITSSCYRVFVSLAIAYMLLYQLPDELKIIGVAMGGAALITFALVPLVKLFKYLTVEPELHRKRGRAWAFCLTVGAAVIALVGIIKFPVDVRAEGVLEAADRKTVFVTSPGFVQAIHVHDGDVVAADAPLVTLRDDELMNERTRIAADIARVAAKSNASYVKNPAEYQIDMKEMAGLQKQLETVNSKIEKLVVKAPTAGRVVAPDLDNRAGEFLPPSTELLQLTSADKLEAFVIVDMGDQGKLVAANKRYTTEIRLGGDSARTIKADRDSITLGTASTNEARNSILTHAGQGGYEVDPTNQSGRGLKTAQYEARVVVPNPGDVIPGQRAYVRLRMDEKQPIGQQAWNWFLRLTMTGNS